MKSTVILGTGSAAPDNILTNFDLEKIMDTSDEWIIQRTGIKERHIAKPGEKFSDFALPASRQALEMAEIDPVDLDMIIAGTLTPDTLMPSGGCTIQALLNADKAAAFDVCAACSGFVYGLAIADRFLKNDPDLNILVIGGELVSHHMDWNDRTTAVLFGDGVGAAVVASRENQGAKILSVEMQSNGKLGELLYFAGLGSEHPVGREDFKPEYNYISMQGREIFKHAIRNMVEISGKAMQKAGVTVDQITKVIPHQANLRIIEMLAKQFKKPLDQVFINIDRYGNTSAGTIPIALDEANRSGFLEKGDLVLLTVFGGGLTWAAAVLEW
ncbi:MAG TPA: ketoacyl-ACP synthase III [Proteobacteria bacterium]|nr:ketoacyl-ACP synthase III [Pseudomonadota bacterium]